MGAGMKTASSAPRAIVLIALLLVALLSVPAQASAAKTVSIVNFAFKPANLTVAKGTRVTFSNTSGIAHTATDKGAFDSGKIKAGKSFTVRFSQTGTFAYHCKIHPTMQGKIVVD